jgi:hypothetical protein
MVIHGIAKDVNQDISTVITENANVLYDQGLVDLYRTQVNQGYK